ncbi:aconitate hydratase AcnA [Oceanobacillus saliphilus]|uniref:aconitate hydratase AcnA n=1 Tax=Oceanobacillus saliphilus TaxID=2925834 RepID=UPI00201E2B12|nr:aconitate hydratase AcnA [Oceanobacillus saliphilus]
MHIKNLGTENQFELDGKQYYYHRLRSLNENGEDNIIRLPYSIRVLLESLLRNFDDYQIKEEHITNLLNWGKEENSTSTTVPFKPSRVILQDLTGVPAVVDLASLRKAMLDLGGDPEQINPEIPVDLVIDHSVQVDEYGTPSAFQKNMELEFERNSERYVFLKWAQEAFGNFKAVPPATGIVHQVNLEYLANVIHKTPREDGSFNAFPDTLVGTDSHTPMINGLGVLGWGVGGIEAEASMLGQASHFPAPEVIGVKFKGDFPEGTTATDLALKITQVLRQKNVVGKFVEFYGEGLENMPLADRATISNMAPEYGATAAYFPVDHETLNYLRLTGRPEEQIAFVEKYCKENDLWYTPEMGEPEYTETIEVNLAELEPNVSGPKRPQDLTPLSGMKEAFHQSLQAPVEEQGYDLSADELKKQSEVQHANGNTSTLKTGSVVIAAITSCTNTSNPHVMLAAGLLAKNAIAKGLTVPDFVKTSLAPGSKVVTRYLDASGLTPYLDQLGFNLTGYGCTTCMGNSGPLDPEIEEAITEKNLIVSSVLSGNRNFEGRIHPLTRANYLASPPLVVAYALTGTVNTNLMEDPLGHDPSGQPVYLKDIWPSIGEINQLIEKIVNPEIFIDEYQGLYESNEQWNAVDLKQDPVYQFDEYSTYIQNPTFFQDLTHEVAPITKLSGLRAIAMLGDTVTTDHISPAGAIPMQAPAGKFLQEKGVSPRHFNSYGSRRGNHEIMMRGTFANIRLRNRLAPGTEGGMTTYWLTDEVMPIYDAAQKYKETGTGLIVIGGKDYGMGSSRDWAAKGTRLLGVKAVIAESFERIHRSNLVMMGVLPLIFAKGENAATLGLDGSEQFDIALHEAIQPNEAITVTVTNSRNEEITFEAIARMDNEVEIEYFRQGGILQKILRDKMPSLEKNKK